MRRAIQRTVEISRDSLTLLSRISTLVQKEAQLHGVSSDNVRAELIAIDLVMGVNEQEIAQRYRVPEEFVREFRENNASLMQEIAMNAFGIHALLRLLVSIKATLFLDSKLWGPWEPIDHMRVLVAKSLLAPMPQVVMDSPQDLVAILREYILQRQAQPMATPVELGEPPPVKSLEEVIHERNESIQVGREEATV